MPETENQQWPVLTDMTDAEFNRFVHAVEHYGRFRWYCWSRWQLLRARLRAIRGQQPR
jgi:hypothetical protein